MRGGSKAVHHVIAVRHAVSPGPVTFRAAFVSLWKRTRKPRTPTGDERRRKLAALFHYFFFGFFGETFLGFGFLLP